MPATTRWAARTKRAINMVRYHMEYMSYRFYYLSNKFLLMVYRPGLHLFLTIASIEKYRLTDVAQWQSFVAQQIRAHGLTLVGEVCHAFPEAGYTAVHCLTESHLSIHTWPEFGLCTCDVFLSNFQRDNSATVQSIGDAIVQYFGSQDVHRNEMER